MARAMLLGWLGFFVVMAWVVGTVGGCTTVETVPKSKAVPVPVAMPVVNGMVAVWPCEDTLASPCEVPITSTFDFGEDLIFATEPEPGPEPLPYPTDRAKTPSRCVDCAKRRGSPNRDRKPAGLHGLQCLPLDYDVKGQAGLSLLDILQIGPWVTVAMARMVLALINGQADPLAFPAAESYARQCHHQPPRRLLALYAIDEILDMFGVEGFANECGTHGVSYANTGDTYAPTMCLVDEERWVVASWGALVEDGTCDYDQSDDSSDWEVTVGNIGCVYRGTNEHEAREHFASYSRDSRENYGRASGEPVALLENGAIVDEINGEPDLDAMSDALASENIEVFEVDQNEIDPDHFASETGPGWYYWACFPGCLPDGEANGPYGTESEAIREAYGEISEMLAQRDND